MIQRPATGEVRDAGRRRRRTDGERSRAAILEAATELATIEGLEGLSIGRLADHVGMSKSGLYAHFNSKEQLQLATIETAQAIFAREVYEPGLRGRPGVARIYALCDAFLSHLERRVFPGGCFFAAAAAELGTREGPVIQGIPHDDAGVSQTDFGDEVLKSRPICRRRTRLAEIRIDDDNLVESPTQSEGALAQIVLPMGTLGIFKHLPQCGLAHVKVRVALEVAGLHFGMGF